MKKTRKIHLFIAVLIGSVAFILVEKEALYRDYIILFHKSAIINHYNDQGRLNGDYWAYVDGKLYGHSYFKNGLREGWCIWYYEKTGRKKREVFYRHGKETGIENFYYENGNLDYTTHWRNNRYDQSQYHYSEDGTLNNYNAFDKSESENNAYCLITYDKFGKFHQILGNVFSDFIYSTCNDSIIRLSNNGKYTRIKDLYISIATPPQLQSSISVQINNNYFSNVSIHNNTAKIPNVFNNSGIYQIKIVGNLKYKNGKMIKADSLKTSLIKI